MFNTSSKRLCSPDSGRKPQDQHVKTSTSRATRLKFHVEIKLRSEYIASMLVANYPYLVPHPRCAHQRSLKIFGVQGALLINSLHPLLSRNRELLVTNRRHKSSVSDLEALLHSQSFLCSDQHGRIGVSSKLQWLDLSKSPSRPRAPMLLKHLHASSVHTGQLADNKFFQPFVADPVIIESTDLRSSLPGEDVPISEPN